MTVFGGILKVTGWEVNGFPGCSRPSGRKKASRFFAPRPPYEKSFMSEDNSGSGVVAVIFLINIYLFIPYVL